MNKNLEKNKLKIFSLGGLQEFGKNCYCLEKNEEIIIIDCGIKFLNDNSNLIDGAIPDFTYLKENKEKIKGLFVTHAHEDHIGAIPHLLDKIPNIPIYGSEFSVALLKQKLDKKVKYSINIFHDETKITTGEFIVKFFRVTHSIPGSFGILVETLNDEKFRVMATGDFKFD